MSTGQTGQTGAAFRFFGMVSAKAWNALAFFTWAYRQTYILHLRSTAKAKTAKNSRSTAKNGQVAMSTGQTGAAGAAFRFFGME
jgi:hypothetical protein